MKTLIETRSKATVAILLLWASPALAQAQFSYATNDGTITIIGYAGPGGAVTIPAIITGLPVTSIGDSAFLNKTYVTSVTIPNSVTSIGDQAFSYCTRLTTVTLGNSVTSIGNRAFFFCISLSAITVDALNLAYISVDGILFNKNQTALIQYPASKTGNQYTIPNSVTNIGGGAFSGCTNLASITIPDSVTSMGDYAFYLCSGLTNVTIPNSVTSIGNGAFYACTHLTSITIPNSVTTIGDQAFYYCTSLTSVTIPNSVTSIGSAAFNYCPSLTAITVDASNPAYSSVDGILFNKNQTALLQYPAGKTGSQYTIPNGVTSIGSGAFAGSGLVSITIPNSVTTIGTGAFGGCASLTSVTIGNSVTSIGDYAFSGCGLTSVTIPNSVTSIGNWAFYGCGLTSVTIGNSVTSIGDYAFSYSGLTSVTIPNSVTNIGNGVFSSCYYLTAITVDASNPAYISVDGVLFNKNQTALLRYPAGKAGSQYTIPNSVTSIGDYAFSHSGLTSVTIPNSVISIGDQAFAFCYSQISVYFSCNAPSLGDSVLFYETYGATVYYLPGTAGWGATFGDRPTAYWHLPAPVILSFGPSFGIQSNLFGFIISWATNIPVVVEASTTLVNPIWSPVGTNTLTDGSSYFSDPGWTNYPSRSYRLRSP